MMQRIKSIKTLAYSASILTFVLVYDIWAGNFIRMYDSILFSSSLVLSCVGLIFVVRYKYSSASLWKLIVFGTVVGYFLSVLLNFGLTIVFTEYGIEDLVNGIERGKIVAKAWGVFGFPLMLGGWALGGVAGFLFHFSGNRSLLG